MKIYRCPTCGKTLTRSEYEKAIKVDKEREAHYHERESDLRARESQLKEHRRQMIAKNKRQLKQDRDHIRDQESARAQRQNVGLKREVETLRDRLRQKERGTTPQSEGLEFEEKLAARLKKQFPEDDIQQKGKGGDVLHAVIFNKKTAGIIIYECKRTPSIQGQHVAQTHRAKQTREADFAVLVTTGRKKGFGGFSQMDGVSVVAPTAVIPLASLLRDHLIEMARLKITKERRAALAQQLMLYIDSPQFKNPIEEVVQRASKLREMIKKEAKDHWHTWQERWTHYETIDWNASQVQNNLRLVMHGGQPKLISQHKAPPLQLPVLGQTSGTKLS